MTQTDLASATGRGKSSISQYESGTSVPDADTLMKLADIFNVSVDYLLGRVNDEEDTFLRDVALLTPEDLMKHYRLHINGHEATTDEIREMIDYIRAKRIMQMMNRD